MILSIKCNCCTHNEVCSKKALYEGTCRDIKSVLTESRKELVTVNLKCKFFVPNCPIDSDEGKRSDTNEL